jgi:hypothetical protein
MVILRLVHIVFGAFWAGAALFMAFVVMPRVQALGPQVAGPVFASLGKVMPPPAGGQRRDHRSRRDYAGASDAFGQP